MYNKMEKDVYEEIKYSEAIRDLMWEHRKSLHETHKALFNVMLSEYAFRYEIEESEMDDYIEHLNEKATDIFDELSEKHKMDIVELTFVLTKIVITVNEMLRIKYQEQIEKTKPENNANTSNIIDFKKILDDIIKGKN